MKKSITLSLLLLLLNCVKIFAQTSVTSRIATRGGNAMFIKEDGTVWVWGYNATKQIDDSKENVQSPIKISGLDNCIAIAMGMKTTNWTIHSLALKNDGTVWAWGMNKKGQLGDGTNEFRKEPNQVKNLVGIKAISAFGEYSMALKNDGTVWAWGENGFGQLGNGTKEDSNLPVKVKNLEGVIAIGAQEYSGFALKSDGTVWAWGWNKFGQLGNDTKENAVEPVQAIGLTDVVSIACGATHTIALKRDGSIWCWGNNFQGQLGDATNVAKTKPVKVVGVDEIHSICAGAYHSMAITDEGKLVAWGLNSSGQLGDKSVSWRASYEEYLKKKGGLASLASVSGIVQTGEAINSNVPVFVYEMSNVVEMNAGTNNSYAITRDGVFWAWGDNGRGALGTTSPPPFSVVPIKMEALSKH